MPRDFLMDDASSQSLQSGRDYLMEEPKESYGYSLLAAIPRILTDVRKGAMGFANQVPSYIESAKTEIPGIFETAKTHPGHLASQALAGSQEAINNIAQFPLNIAKYGSERLNLLPESVPNAVEKITPQDTSQAINQLFGQPEYPGEELARGITRNIPAIVGSKELGSLVLAGDKSLAKQIINKHDNLESSATKKFNLVSQGVNERNINQVPIDTNLIDDLKDYFPKTKQASSLLNDAKTGNYNSLRKLQSDLYKKGKDNLKSPLEVERMKGEELLEKRDDINQAISNHLKETGNTDLNDILNSARNDYRTLQQVYYNPNLNRAIINMVDKDTRKIPKNLMSVLKEKSIPMSKLRDFHPGLNTKLLSNTAKKNISEMIKKLAIPLGAGGLGAYGTYEYMRPQDNSVR